MKGESMKKTEKEEQAKQAKLDRVRHLLAWSAGVATTLWMVSGASASLKLPRGSGD